MCDELTFGMSLQYVWDRLYNWSINQRNVFFLMTCSLIYVLSFIEAEIIYLYLNYICMILSEAKKLII